MLIATLTNILGAIILVAIVRSHVKSDTDGMVTLNWGNAVWMTLGATILLWLGLLSAVLGVFRGRKQR